MANIWKADMNHLFSQQFGMISARQLIEKGCSERTIRRMASEGALQTVLPGVFRSPSWPMGREQLMVAGCLRNSAAALAFTTAGQIHGLRKMFDDRVHLLVPHGSSPDLPGLVVHRCRKIDPEDVVPLGNGMRVTSVARTLFDVGGVIGHRRVVSALENALDRKLVNMDAMSEVTLRLFHRRRPGSREIRSALLARSDWTSALQSDLEVRVLAAIRRAGLPMPVVQYELSFEDGHIVRFDFAWPHIRVALEVDHSFWHVGSEESRKDKQRDRKVATLSWQTLRITEDDVRVGLDGVMLDLAAIIRAAEIFMGVKSA
jgi:predicted transcriptional regulator of viral defense system